MADNVRLSVCRPSLQLLEPGAVMRPQRARYLELLGRLMFGSSALHFFAHDASSPPLFRRKWVSAVRRKDARPSSVSSRSVSNSVRSPKDSARAFNLG